MKIHGYWTDVPELNRDHELHLVHLWTHRWRAVGWDPWVLTEWDARKHPYFDEFDRVVSALPSVNPKSYERACYLRWLALAADGGGYMADFDLIPYLVPGQCIKLAESESPRLQMFQACSPSFVYATSKVCEALCRDVFAKAPGEQTINDQQHHSDQYALQAVPDGGMVERLDLVKGYGDPGWESAPFVHYSAGSMYPSGKVPKYRWIPQLRK